MKPRTLSLLDRVELLLYSIREQNGTALPAIQNANEEQAAFWTRILREYGTKLFNIVDFYHLRRVVADSQIIEEVQIFSEDWILSFARQPVTWDFENLRKIEPEFVTDLSNAVLEIGRISRGQKPVLVRRLH